MKYIITQEQVGEFLSMLDENFDEAGGALARLLKPIEPLTDERIDAIPFPDNFLVEALREYARTVESAITGEKS